MTDDIKAHGIGKPVRRKEDGRLVVGRGCFSDDVNLPGQAYAQIVRSAHAHAKIVKIDTRAALEVDGVIAVLTGQDVAADGLRSIPHRPVLKHPADVRIDESAVIYISSHPILPIDRARFIGEAVAIVVAETVDAAKQAADLVEVEVEQLPAVTITKDAARDGAQKIWDASQSNIALDAAFGDREQCDVAFKNAHHVVGLQTWIQRVTGTPMEPRAAVGDYDAKDGKYTLFAGSGNVVRQKRELATILGAAETDVRVVARDIGGNFGTRNAFYPEFALVVWAARRIGRPVKWTCERQEAFLSDYQGRDLYVEAELALDEHGRFLALRGSNLSNVGAHTVAFVPLTKGVGLMTSVYDVKSAFFRARAVHSNTPPTNSYRSAGRPEAMFVVERLIDIAAQTLGFDRVDLRKRNLIAPEQMPYANPLGLTYDNGCYGATMERALELADWAGFPARRAQARHRGLHRGIAVANYVEITSGVPRERAELRIYSEGRIELVIGTLSSGQGHETSFAQLLTEWLHVSPDRIRIITGDTDVVMAGGGSQSGRSMRMASIVVGHAVEEILNKGRRLAAHVLQADPSSIQFANGVFSSRENQASVGLFELAACAEGSNSLPDDLAGPLSAVSDETIGVGGYPYGTQVVEVDVDHETGKVEFVNYVAIDDVGRAINPLILEGQTHGGIAQGVGQALIEQCQYEPNDGQLLSGSFMDYGVPRASDLPFFTTELSEVPSPSNALGIRAGGEGGTTPALGVVINAIVDALSEFGVTHIEMPATPQRIWQAVKDAQLASLLSAGV